MKEWQKSDWRAKPRVQMPDYTDDAALAKVEQQLSNLSLIHISEPTRPY